MIPAFPKIFTVGQKYIANLFSGVVEITEKIDGSQFAFGMTSEGLQMRSKGAMLYGDSNKMFLAATSYIESIQHTLPTGVVFYCEYLTKPKHNCLTYRRVPKNNLMLFGAVQLETSFCFSYLVLEDMAEDIGVETVPLLYHGTINSVDELLKFMEYESELGGTKVEGIVVKNYNIPMKVGDYFYPLSSGKMVSEEFKEKNQHNWKQQSNTSKLTALLESYRTEARWRKAVQHLRDAGTLLEEPKDIGSLIREVQRDILEEETEDLKESLFKIHKDELLRTAIRGLPQWYKDELLKNVEFKGGENVTEA